MDFEGIEWLEKILKDPSLTVLMISHDRYFLENVTSRTLEINSCYPDGLLSFEGSYCEFLLKKEEFLNSQEQWQNSLASKVRREVAWLQQNAKARTTKSTARIKQAESLINELQNIKNRNTFSTSKIQFLESQRKTKKLITLNRVTKSFGNKTLFKGIDFTLYAGMKVGLVGNNGSGKTTFLKLITQELAPDEGTLQKADQLNIVFFDQTRKTLDPKLSLLKTLCPFGDSIKYQGQWIHAASWAKKFLFRNEQLELPVGRLSGGESARILIAKLMLEPADVLILDEPTNDLDIPTLEVLEESLLEFQGALLIVSHDRYMLDRVCNLIISFDGNGQIEQFADIDQWKKSISEKDAKKNAFPEKKPEFQPSTSRTKAQPRLSYKEKLELEQIESTIQGAEERVQLFERKLQEIDVAKNATLLQKTCQDLKDAQEAVENLYARWAELEDKQSQSEKK